MNLPFHCLFIVFCFLNFASSVPSDDSDFIDEKGKALKNLKGKPRFLSRCLCDAKTLMNTAKVAVSFPQLEFYFAWIFTTCRSKAIQVLSTA